MRTVLIATGYAPRLAAITAEQPAPMLPLMGKPFIQHIVEVLVGQGCRQLDVLVHEHPDQIEALLGDGVRWGAAFTFHVCRTAHLFDDQLALLAQMDGEGLRIVFGDCLALDGYAGLFACTAKPETPVQLASYHSDAGVVPVWACVSSAGFKPAAQNGTPLGTSAALIAAALSHAAATDTAKPLLWQSYSDLLETTQRVMNGEGPGLLVTGRVTDANVWLGRNVSLHPSARIEPPVYVGSDCDIGACVSLGPYVAIESNCVLDRACSVRNSLVFGNTYVGEALELDNVVATAKRIANARYDVAVPIPDEFLLGSLKVELFRQSAARFASRVFGAVLLVALAPCWLLGVALWLAGGLKGWPSRLACIRLPAEDDPLFWRPAHYFAFLSGREGGGRHFFSRFLPGLLAVVKGELSLVGVPPRTRQEIEALSDDWRQLYVRGRSGLIVEPGVIYSTPRSQDDAFAADAWFISHSSVAHEFVLVCRYLFGRWLSSHLRRICPRHRAKGGAQ
jgi:acetyltransferase-like isoleucine patch superfamily enzyme